MYLSTWSAATYKRLYVYVEITVFPLYCERDSLTASPLTHLGKGYISSLKHC